MNEYWDEAPTVKMFEELARRSQPLVMSTGRRWGKTDLNMYAALYSGPLADGPEPKSDTSGYARVPCVCGDPSKPGILHRKDGPCSVAVVEEHGPLQVVLFNKDGKEPIRDPAYRRISVEFVSGGEGLYVNAKTVAFPVATRDWGEIDEALIYNEEGDNLFVCPIACPVRVHCGLTVSFAPGSLKVHKSDWEFASGDKPESTLATSGSGSLFGIDLGMTYTPTNSAFCMKPLTREDIKEAATQIAERSARQSTTDYFKFFGDPKLPEATTPPPEPVAVSKAPESFVSMFKARYGAFFTPGPEGTTTGNYNFPVIQGIEHGQHPWPCHRNDCAYCARDEHGEKYQDKILGGIKIGADVRIDKDKALILTEPYRTFMITGITAPLDAPKADPAVTTAEKLEEKTAEDSPEAVREHNRKIMLGG